MKVTYLKELSLAVLAAITCCRPAHGDDVTDQAEMKALVQKRDRAAAEQDTLNKQIAALESKINHQPPPTENAPKNPIQNIASEYNLKVGQSLIDKNKTTLPALFQYTHQSHGKDSAQVDAGISVSHDIDNSFEIPLSVGLTSEYHYNNVASQRQNNLAIGGMFDAVLGPSTEYGQLIRASAMYKHDDVISGDGLQAGLLWFVAIPELHIGDFYWNWNNIVAGRIEPTIGLQYETGNGASAAFKDGDRFAFEAGISIKMALLPDYFANRLELNLGVNYWNNIATSGGYNGYLQNQMYYVEGVTYWLNTGSDPTGKLGDKEKNFGISVQYTDGNNPSTSDFRANRLTLGLAIQF
jgi:hypothetical protein